MRNKLIKILRTMKTKAFNNVTQADYLMQHDVVPVVRCKDCYYFSTMNRKNNAGTFTFCRKIICGVKADDFCSYGERKTND